MRGVDFAGLAKSGRLARDLKRAALAGLAFVVVLAVFYKFPASRSCALLIQWEIIRLIPSRNSRLLSRATRGTRWFTTRTFVVKVKHSGHRPRELFLTYHPPNHPEKAVTVPMFDKGNVGFYQEIAEHQI